MALIVIGLGGVWRWLEILAWLIVLALLGLGLPRALAALVVGATGS